MSTMKLLMVSGGGSAINYSSLAAGGGGGGGVYYNSAYEIRANSYNIIVGAGSGVNSGQPGGNTVFGSEIVYGGALGETAANAYGGGGGGQRNNVGGNFAGGAYGYASGYSSSGHAAGGGGAGGVGGNASDVTGGGSGGAGIACDITGTSLIYGEGGGGGYGGTTTGVGGRGAVGVGSPGNPGMDGRGGGGGGTYNGYGSGRGGSGTVIVSYITSEWGACTGGTITTNGIYTVHTFTANGTFTVVHAIKKIAGVAPQSGISLDATTVKSNGTASANNCTWSHTVSPGTDRALVVYIPMSQGVYPSSVTYGGTAITTNLSAAYDANAKAYIFIMVNPPVGTANIVVTFNGTLQYLLASAASFFGVNQTVPLINSTITTGAGQNKSFNVYSPYGGCWILECIGMSSTTNTAASGQTAITGVNRISSYDNGTVISNNTQSWTADGAAGYAYIGVNLAPARTHFNKVGGILGTSLKKIMNIGNR